jgi:cbb3-type cytochrome oxidase maturation protein
MSIVYLLVPFALLLGLGFLWMFVASAGSGQFEDLVTPAYRILMDETELKKEKKNEQV